MQKIVIIGAPGVAAKVAARLGLKHTEWILLSSCSFDVSSATREVSRIWPGDWLVDASGVGAGWMRGVLDSGNYGQSDTLYPLLKALDDALRSGIACWHPLLPHPLPRDWT